jgi:hypothetical protein
MNEKRIQSSENSSYLNGSNVTDKLPKPGLPSFIPTTPYLLPGSHDLLLGKNETIQ